MMLRLSAIICTGILLCLSWPGAAGAVTDEPIYDMNVEVSDKHSLQRGARLFVNYCMGCHSAKYMRYSRMATDLGIPENILQKNLMVGTDKPGDTMETAMSAKQAGEWFNAIPPDLTLIARSRGADWLYSYLLTFYRDPESPTGFNNLQFKDVSMPHVLWELQGIKRPVSREGSNGRATELETVVPGKMSDQEYQRAMQDLVNFMVYLSEPVRLQRYTMGFWAIFYLLIFLCIVYLLKKEYWRDVH